MSGSGPEAHGSRAWARRWAFPGGIGLVCAALAIGGESLREWGRYERAGLHAGQWWRLVSGHLVHLGWSHVALNLSALALLAALTRAPLSALEWGLVLMGSALAIDAGLYLFHAEVAWYVGLSGVLHGVAVVVAAHLWRTERWIGVALAMALTSKVLAEQLIGPSAWSIAASGGPVVVAAHLYGAAGGLLALLVVHRLRPPGPDILPQGLRQR